MCNFFSAIALKNGDILWHSMVDSHSELIEYFKLPDTRSYHQHFAKCELSPSQDDEAHWMNPQQWAFKLDEETEPSWWPDVAAKVEASMRDKATRMILKDDSKPMILDGCWIVGGKAKIREVRSGRIVRIWGGTVSAIRGGTVSEIRGGTVSAIRGGTVSAIRGGAVSDIWGGTVSEILGGTVSAIRGGTVSAIRGGTVSAILGGTVSAIRGGTVSEIRPSDYYTLALSDQARAELLKRGVLKA